jgi:hypothetical protein
MAKRCEEFVVCSGRAVLMCWESKVSGLCVQTGRSQFVPLLRMSCVPVVFHDLMILKVCLNWLFPAYLFVSKLLLDGRRAWKFVVSVLNVRNCVYGKRRT